MNIFKGQRPDITPNQVKAAVIWIVAQIVAWGFIDANTAQYVLSVAATIYSSVLIHSDMKLRVGRAQATAVETAALAKSPLP